MRFETRAALRVPEPLPLEETPDVGGRALPAALGLRLRPGLAHRELVAHPPHVGGRVVDETAEGLGVEPERRLLRGGPRDLGRRLARGVGRFLGRRDLGEALRFGLVRGRARVVLGGPFVSHLVIDVELLVLAFGERQVVLEAGAGDGDLRLRDDESAGRRGRRRRRLRLRRLGNRFLRRGDRRQGFDQRFERLRLVERGRLEGVEERFLLRFGRARLRRHGNEPAHEQEQQQQVESGRGDGDGRAPPDGDAGQVVDRSAPAQAGEQPAGGGGIRTPGAGARRRPGTRTAEGRRPGRPAGGFPSPGGSGLALFGVDQSEPLKVGTHRSGTPASSRNSRIA